MIAIFCSPSHYDDKIDIIGARPISRVGALTATGIDGGGSAITSLVLRLASRVAARPPLPSGDTPHL